MRCRMREKGSILALKRLILVTKSLFFDRDFEADLLIQNELTVKIYLLEA